jgi:hypothetical protein
LQYWGLNSWVPYTLSHSTSLLKSHYLPYKSERVLKLTSLTLWDTIFYLKIILTINCSALFTFSRWITPQNCIRYFQDRVSWTIYPGCLWTAILLISASWVARNTAMNHPCLASFCFFNVSAKNSSKGCWLKLYLIDILPAGSVHFHFISLTWNSL